MNAAYFRRMIDYTYWAHRQVWNCVMELNDAQFAQTSDYSIGSIHEQVVHTMSAERLWLQRVRGEKTEPFSKAEVFPTRASVRAEWDEIEGGWRAFVNNLTDDQLENVIEYTSTNGLVKRSQPLWEGLAQVVNHATDHRAQMLALIHQVGGKTLAQDFIFYTWEQPGS